jgi:hypothetical protein
MANPANSITPNMATPQVVLGAPNLIGIVNLTQPGIPDVFASLPGFSDANPRKIDGTEFTYFWEYGSRQGAPYVPVDAPSKTVQVPPIGRTSGTTFTTKIDINIKPAYLASLLQYDSLAKQQDGANEIRRQVQQPTQRIKNNRIILMASAMFQGYVWWDKNGAILTSSANSVSSINFGIPTTNTGGCNIFNTAGGDTLYDWQAAGTNIPQQLTNFKKQAMQNTSYPVKHAFYGSNIAGYFANNTEVQAYLSRDTFRKDGGAHQFLDTGELPDGTNGSTLFGIAWHPAWQQYQLTENSDGSASGTPTSFVGSDSVVFCPDPDPSWIRWIEGSSPVPADANNFRMGTPQSLADMGIAFKHGQYAYCERKNNPVGATVIVGDNCIPMILNPFVVYQATVTIMS